MARTGPCWAQVRVYELGQLGMKFERHLDSEVVDFQVGTYQIPSACTAPLLRTLPPHVKDLLTFPWPS